MKKPKLLARMPLYAETIDSLSPFFDVDVHLASLAHAEAEVVSKLKDAEAVLWSGFDKFERHHIQHSINAKIVCTVSNGYNNLDIEALSSAGIIATNAATPELSAEATSEIAIGLLICAARQLGQKGPAAHLLSQSVAGKTLGILGLGAIGKSAAKKAALGLEMVIQYHNRSPIDTSVLPYDAKYVSKEDLFKNADFLLVSTSYTRGSPPVVTSEQLKLMKSSAILINVSRGGAVDESALIKALQAKNIAGAGLDVFEQEPKINPLWLNMPNVVMTPHLGGLARNNRAAMEQVAVQNVISAIVHKNAPSMLNASNTSLRIHHA